MPTTGPYAGRPGLGQFAGLDFLEKQWGDAMFGSAVFHLSDLFRDALAGSALGSTGIAADFARALDETVRSSKNQLAKVNHALGQLMQADTLDAYRTLRATAASARGLPPYRPPFLSGFHSSKRDAAGRMEAALGDPDFFWATYDGIGFGNRKMLDRTARQWHRLNYGARGASGSSGAAPSRFQIHWQGLVVGSLGLPAEPSRGIMRMPVGLFKEGAFFPIGKKAIYPTKGIQAWNFFDAGIKTLAQEIGPAYEAQYRRWLTSSRSNMGPLSRVVTFNGTGKPS